VGKSTNFFKDFLEFLFFLFFHIYIIIIWAGPAQLTRPDSAQKGRADLGPKVLSTSLGLGRTRLTHKGWVRTGLAQKKKKKQGGRNYFPPPILLHADARETYAENKVKVEGK
jgi:hypothetical protein